MVNLKERIEAALADLGVQYAVTKGGRVIGSASELAASLSKALLHDFAGVTACDSCGEKMDSPILCSDCQEVAEQVKF